MDYNIIIIVVVLVAGVAGFIVLARDYLEQLEGRITGQGRSGRSPKQKEPGGN